MDYEFSTPSLAVERYETIEGKGFDRIENGCAWYGGTVKAWANTTYSRILDHACESIYEGLKTIASELKITNIRNDVALKEILRNITTAYVSDSRWSSAPTSPGQSVPLIPLTYSLSHGWSLL